MEALNKPLEKAIRAAHIDNRPWQQELSRFLLNYRSAPHSSTKIPQAQLLCKREIIGKLPVKKTKQTLSRHKEANKNKNKTKGKLVNMPINVDTQRNLVLHWVMKFLSYKIKITTLALLFAQHQTKLYK